MNARETVSVSSPDGDSIVAEIHIDAPPERVFQALTEQAELVRWFNDASRPVHRWEMDARAGGRFRYFVDDATAARSDVSAFECRGEILEFDPPRLLSYTWVASWHADRALGTVVRWELTATAGGTRVKLIHSGLSNEHAARKDYLGGWSDTVRMLKSFSEAIHYPQQTTEPKA